MKSSRKIRKEADRKHLKDVSIEAKIIKLIDRIDNLMKMKGADTSYVKESKLLLDAIGRDIDPELTKKLEAVMLELRKKVGK